MNLKDAQGYYTRHSTSLSAVCRQLAFAGIAVVWIFVNKDGGQYSIPNDLLFPLTCFVVGLAFDLLQYFYASAAWGIYSRLKELELGDNSTNDFLAPRWINWPTILFFWLKAIALITGYLSMIFAL